eukprot:2338-Heterococcus_DN1.PRE.6
MAASQHCCVGEVSAAATLHSCTMPHSTGAIGETAVDGQALQHSIVTSGTCCFRMCRDESLESNLSEQLCDHHLRPRAFTGSIDSNAMPPARSTEAALRAEISQLKEQLSAERSQLKEQLSAERSASQQKLLLSKRPAFS